MAEPSKEPEGKAPVERPTESKEEAFERAKAHRVQALTARNNALQLEIDAVRGELETVQAKLKNPAAETVANHIKLLHAYNEIRDVGQGLIGMIADGRNVRAVEVYEEFGVGSKD